MPTATSGLLVYAVVIIAIFRARSATRASGGLVVAAVPLALVFSYAGTHT